ncbi:YqeG family HAD IIIA-type phosphatase [Secundilactobacillus kimchicus]|uniref:HAD superfamily hydrolase n=1 Tax=Secundilactobacillus kimchicus JCM 15530 TaxID=1302272 RepID=A0A0R1I1Q7_9LACO|nr:YqeG family HAD IIIA-type phosphatase [Secundilactobacillus kimchicus]KRK49223.1 HAD superfamily hydrolase [Secundilactobacillus kimchicus JCM 15530]MBT9672767.1 YqeG family HAD IIIA-type phosphatase [Secundilactobacillus kimchicus]
MLAKFLPTWMVQATYDISPTKLKELGIKVVLTDLDNTLIAWNNPYGTQELRTWMAALKAAGIALVVVSNNSQTRVDRAVSKLELPFVSRALKPLTRGIKKAMHDYQVTKDEVVMVGDQLLTDIWAANNSGIASILVKPILPSDAWNTRINRFFEKFVMTALVKKYPKLTYRKDININERNTK